jgi:plastocyanin
VQRRRFLRAVGVGATTLAAGCLGFQPTADSYDVGMTAQAFRPREITVSVGDTVVWKNTSTRAHSVTAYEAALPSGADYFATGGFDTEQSARDAWDDNDGVITNGQTFGHRFEVAGEFPYFCIPHETAGMVGTVIAEE